MTVNVKDRKWVVVLSERASIGVGVAEVYVGTIKVKASTPGEAADKALVAAKIYWGSCDLVVGSVSCEDVVDIDLTEEESEDKKLEEKQ